MVWLKIKSPSVRDTDRGINRLNGMVSTSCFKTVQEKEQGDRCDKTGRTLLPAGAG